MTALGMAATWLWVLFSLWTVVFAWRHVAKALEHHDPASETYTGVVLVTFVFLGPTSTMLNFMILLSAVWWVLERFDDILSQTAVGIRRRGSE